VVAPSVPSLSRTSLVGAEGSFSRQGAAYTAFSADLARTGMGERPVVTSVVEPDGTST
jgi:hypothetical protein